MDENRNKEQLNQLKALICHTYENEKLSVQAVIDACDKLSKSLHERQHLTLLTDVGIPEYKAREELQIVKYMMSREYLEKRLELELGTKTEWVLPNVASTKKVQQKYRPLGVLLHIAAGNVDALPVFSVIEGLITGNINLLKLPGQDNGLSIWILQKLIQYYPLIANYVVVFDYPSEDIESMKKMADAADAIVVWGGDTAVSAVRKLAKPNTKIIEWGHKISFAYVSGKNIADDELEKIAYNICDTNQLFCNSCQGIYVDTDDFEEVIVFARRFCRILDSKSQSMPQQDDLYIHAQKTLECSTEELEAINTGNKSVFRTKNCGVIAYNNSLLEPSYMFRNCWVKPLPKNRLLIEMIGYKNHLQTVALVCEEEDRQEFEDIFFHTGVVRITNGENMSKSYCGIAHDGDFALRRYMKVVSCEY